MKAIIIGTSLAGKTTLIRYLRANTNLNVSEIDEELTEMNGGTYPLDDDFKRSVLTPKVIQRVFESDILFFTNTHYFTESDLREAKQRGYKIIQLELPLEKLKVRNIHRVKHEGYGDLSEYLEGMVEYQKEIKGAGLVDAVISADQAVKEVADRLMKTLEK